MINKHIYPPFHCEFSLLTGSLSYSGTLCLCWSLQASWAASFPSLWVTGHGWPFVKGMFSSTVDPGGLLPFPFWNIALVLIGWFPWFHWKNVRKSILDLICMGHWLLCWAPAECVVYHSFALWIYFKWQNKNKWVSIYCLN